MVARVFFVVSAPTALDGRNLPVHSMMLQTLPADHYTSGFVSRPAELALSDPINSA